MPWAVPYKSPVELYGRWWSPYTADQVVANIMVLRHVQNLFGSLRRPWILGHEQVQRSKQDPGPAFPIHGVREAVFEQYQAIRHRPWFRLFDMDRYAGRTERDGIVIEWAKLPGNETPNLTPAVAWAKFDAKVRALLGESGCFGPVGKTALRLLGYHVAELAGELSDEDLISLRIFQRMAGLPKPDGQPGVRTKEALVSQLVKKRFLDPEIIS
jgi:N-acetyl-anhydromuramyl-L-alanine amidase AmpD